MPGKSKPDMCFFPRDSTFSISALPGVGKPMLLPERKVWLVPDWHLDGKSRIRKLEIHMDGNRVRAQPISRASSIRNSLIRLNLGDRGPDSSPTLA